ncbi:hypothetical protein [Oceanobacillus halophilus]|uniref:Uncharacterized protein n=1 Tax=Oceanobacillus halophilus TaxID=930130 RepID=A0A495A305_9BACI|nr:hypothetical protein [Oceanobacillus halophilus]RKQ33957.1 hypothetical protein D8M06_09045 [Oceanobacillus halophilus]
MTILQKNIIGNILFFTGIGLIVVGIISAYLNAEYVNYVGPHGEEETVFEWRFFLSSMTQSIFNGMMLIAFSEFIKYLDALKNKNMQGDTPTQEHHNEHSSLPVTPSEKKHEVWTLTENDQEKIYELYANQAILEITASNTKGYCIVKVQDYNGPLDPGLKVVDVRGQAAEEVHHAETVNQLLASYRNT